MKGINVLSLFDGMSCGRIALERTGIEVDNYYSSEIDKYALKIADKNYPQDIKNRLGDVTKIDTNKLPIIDLLIGGSPCQGFSFAGKQLNFDDERSKLFFEYVRVLKEVKPKYFLLENVKMKKEYQDIISGYLGVEPIEINSALISAQNRKRLYWTNINEIEQPKDRSVFLEDVLITQWLEKYSIFKRKGSIKYPLKKYKEFELKNKYVPKMFNPYNCSEIKYKHPTLTAVGSRIGNSSTVLIKNENGDIRSLSPIEWERLQTLRDNYTEGINSTQRYNCLGNGWTVDVIAHILSYTKFE